MELSAAARVGMLAVVALILLGLIFVQVGHVGPEVGERYHIMFKDIQGLQVRAPVQLAGVRVGHVVDLQLTEQNRVDVSVAITREGVGLFSSDYFVYTITGNLLGDKWVEIKPGPVPEGVKALAAGDSVQGTSPISLDQLAQEGSEVMKEFQASIAALNEIIGDGSFQNDIKITMNNFREVSGNLKGASADARTLVRGLNGRVETLAGSLERVVGHVDATVLTFQADARCIGSDLRDTTSAVRTVVADNTGNIDTIVTNLRQMSSSLKNTASALESLATDETMHDDILAIVANIRKTSEQVATIASDVRSITGDPQVQEDIKVTIRNAREATESGKRVVNKVEGVVDRVSGGKGLLGGGRRIFEGDVSHEWNVNTGNPAANINATLFPDGGPVTVRLGVDSIGHDNLVNAQVGKTWDSWRIRGGVVRSQFGIGADAWMFDKRLEANVEVYDTKDIKVDVLGRVRLPGDFYVYGGVRDVTDGHNSYPVVGAGKRF